MKKLIFVLTILFLSSLFLSTYAASRGGTLTVNLDAEPSTLNPFTSSDGYSQAVEGYVLEGLLTIDIDTYQFKPALAEKWEVSKDKKWISYTLREGAKFSDGQPVTTEDVKFSFDAVKDLKYKAIVLREYLSGVDRAEIVDARTIKFFLKDAKYKNFDYLSGGILKILPKHIYKNPDEKYTRILVGAGPYMIDKYEKGKRIVLKRNPHYWGTEQNTKAGENNFDNVALRFVESQEVQVQMLVKKELDYLGLRPEQFVKQTTGPEWGKTLFKVETQNKAPKGYNYIGWNQKHPILGDKTVRKALAHLVNRKLMIEKFLYNMSVPVDGPIPPMSEYAPKISPIEFDPKKGLKMLNDAGWTDSDKDGVLDKTMNGKKTNLKVSVMMPTNFWEKYLTIFKEDAKKVGVDIEIKNVEWNAFLKLLDEGNFDGIIMAWGGGDVDQDMGLRQIWHSAAAVKGGSNRISYKNPKVDTLIEQANVEWDKPKRIKLCQEVFKLIADDAPYAFLFATAKTLYGYTNKVEKPKDTFNYGVGLGYWWAATAK